MNATRYLDRVWLVCSIVGITIGGAMWIAGAHDAAKVAWAVTTVIGGIPLVVDVVRSIARREPSVDFIALLAIIEKLYHSILAGSENRIEERTHFEDREVDVVVGIERVMRKMREAPSTATATTCRSRRRSPTRTAGPARSGPT